MLVQWEGLVCVIGSDFMKRLGTTLKKKTWTLPPFSSVALWSTPCNVILILRSVCHCDVEVIRSGVYVSCLNTATIWSPSYLQAVLVSNWCVGRLGRLCFAIYGVMVLCISDQPQRFTTPQASGYLIGICFPCLSQWLSVTRVNAAQLNNWKHAHILQQPKLWFHHVDSEDKFV